MSEKKPNKAWPSVRLELTDIEWDILQLIAKNKGRSDIRRLINVELRKFSEQWQEVTNCNGKITKRVNYYEMPYDLEKFYDSLSKRFDKPISSIVFRFVILPLFSNCSDYNVMNKLPKRKKPK